MAGDVTALLQKILNLIDAILVPILFPADQLFDYSFALTVNANKDRPKSNRRSDNIVSHRKLLFQHLKKIISAKDKNTSLFVLRSLDYLYRCFLEVHQDRKESAAQGTKKTFIVPFLKKRNRKESEGEDRHENLDFLFFLELHEIIAPYLSLDLFSGEDGVPYLAAAFEALSGLLSVMNNFGVYRESQDYDKEKYNILASFTDLHQQLIDSFPNTKHPKYLIEELIDKTFGHLRSLVELNHLIVEPYIQKLWRFLFSYNWEQEVGEESVAFSVVQLKTYVQLRQFEDLLKTLFFCLRTSSLPSQPSPPNSFILHNKEFLNQFYIALSKLPLGKIPLIWKLYIREMIDNYFPYLFDIQKAQIQKKQKSENSQTSRMMIVVEDNQNFENGENEEDIEEGQLSSAFTELIGMFVAFLTGILIIDSNAPILLNLITQTHEEIVGPVIAYYVSKKKKKRKKGNVWSCRHLVPL